MQMMIIHKNMFTGGIKPSGEFITRHGKLIDQLPFVENVLHPYLIN